MEFINIGFHLLSGVLALLVSALLLWVNVERRHSNRLLAFVLILFAFQNLLLVLFFSHLILKVPVLIRVFTPTTFLIAPIAFLYTRSVLNEEFKFKKYDWLLLIPAFLVLINFIPYYILPINEKINYVVKNFYGNKQGGDMGRGFLPTIPYYIIRICWSGFFLFLGFRLIFRFKRRNTIKLLARNSALLSWLLMFWILLAVVFGALILKVLVPPLSGISNGIGDILLGLTILFISLQLFIRPQVLYGIFEPVAEVPTAESAPANQLSIRETALSSNPATPAKNIETGREPENMGMELETQLRYKKIIETFFRETKPYLQTDYSLEQLVADIHLPRYVISAFINREYGMGFREFLNTHRVDFFKDNLSNPLWSNLTLEAIASECGFNSRSTFISNFKKIAGLTPSEYVKQKNI